jgi:hypothetical protein
MDWDRSSGCADRFREADEFFDSLALYVQANQQCTNLRVGALAREDFAHHRARLIAREGLAVIHNAVQGFENHVSAKIVRQKHSSPVDLSRSSRSRRCTFSVNVRNSSGHAVNDERVANHLHV